MLQRSKEWHEYRKNHLGASDSPVIMEVSPYKTRLQLWEEKVLGKESPMSSSMNFGAQMEDKIRDMVYQLFGKKFEPVVKESVEEPFLIASLDGEASDGSIIEIKCANLNDHIEAKSKRIPIKYIPQLQHQLFVCKLDGMHYISYHKDDLQVVEVEADKAYQKDMVEREREFWERVLSFDPPAMTDKDFICMDHDDEFLQRFQKLKDLEQQIKQAEKEADEAKKTLLSVAQGRNVVSKYGKISKVVRRGNIEYSKIEALKDLDLDQYRKEASEFWKFSLA